MEFIDSTDPWRPLNVYTHAPGSIGQIVVNQGYSSGSEDFLFYYFYDALGNVVAIMDDDTEYITLYEQDAFGNRIPGSNTWEPITMNTPKEHLTGKMYDQDAELYYFHARWYDPNSGLYISRDPFTLTETSIAPACSADWPAVVMPVAIGFSKMGDTNALSPYIHCRCNPIRYVDASGQWSFDFNFYVGLGLGMEVGCNPGGGCCWARLSAGIGLGAGIGYNPMASRKCPSWTCGKCFYVGGKCEASLSVLIVEVGLGAEVGDGIFCTKSKPDPETIREHGGKVNWLSLGAKILANCSFMGTVYW